MKTPEKLVVQGFAAETSLSTSVREEYVTEKDVSEVVKQHKEV